MKRIHLDISNKQMLFKIKPGFNPHGDYRFLSQVANPPGVKLPLLRVKQFPAIFPANAIAQCIYCLLGVFYCFNMAITI